jgi:hypothetical protein
VMFLTVGIHLSATRLFHSGLLAEVDLRVFFR